MVAELEALGIPHPHVCIALVGALAAQGEKIGQQNLAIITQCQKKVQHLGDFARETVEFSTVRLRRHKQRQEVLNFVVE